MSEVKQIRPLTSLRFLAAFAVVLYHAGSTAAERSGIAPKAITNFLSNGYIGVSFFFVLSGFILTLVYQDKLATRDQVANYAVARFARIYPVYILCLLALLTVAEGPIAWKDLPQFVLLQCWVPLGTYQREVLSNWNIPAWTLSAELFFYLSFPLLIGAIGRWRDAGVMAATGVMAAIIIATGLSGPPEAIMKQTPALAYVPIPLLRVPEFIYGITLGVLWRRGRIPRSPLALFAAALLIVAAMASSTAIWVASVVAVLAGAVIALVPNSLDSGPVARLLRSDVMVLLGAASYSLYLLQVPVHLYAHRGLADLPPLLGKLAFYPAVIVSSLLVFRFYEEPMRSLINRGHRRLEQLMGQASG